jgi:hypothetical protein
MNDNSLIKAYGLLTQVVEQLRILIKKPYKSYLID